MVIFHSYVKLPEGTPYDLPSWSTGVSTGPVAISRPSPRMSPRSTSRCCGEKVTQHGSTRIRHLSSRGHKEVIFDALSDIVLLTSCEKNILAPFFFCFSCCFQRSKSHPPPDTKYPSYISVQAPQTPGVSGKSYYNIYI